MRHARPNTGAGRQLVSNTPQPVSNDVHRWMRAVEIVLDEMTFVISQGEILDKGAEAHSIIRAGLDDMKEIRGALENRLIP